MASIINSNLFGINIFRNPKFLALHWLLILPFLGKIGNYPIGYRGEK